MYMYGSLVALFLLHSTHKMEQQEQQALSPLLQLPPELLFHITSFLNYTDVIRWAHAAKPPLFDEPTINSMIYKKIIHDFLQHRIVLKPKGVNLIKQELELNRTDMITKGRLWYLVQQQELPIQKEHRASDEEVNLFARGYIKQFGQRLNPKGSDKVPYCHLTSVQSAVKDLRSLDRELRINTLTKRFDQTIFYNLINDGADIDAQDNNGKTTLHWASWFDNETPISFILSYKPTINTQDKKGQTPLHCAALAGLSTTTRILLEHDADPNIIENLDNTALHLACGLNHRKIVELLILHNADTDIKNGEGKTPIEVARYHNHNDIVALLTNAS